MPDTIESLSRQVADLQGKVRRLDQQSRTIADERDQVVSASRTLVDVVGRWGAPSWHQSTVDEIEAAVDAVAALVNGPSRAESFSG